MHVNVTKNVDVVIVCTCWEVVLEHKVGDMHFIVHLTELYKGERLRKRLK